ncbi:MAG: hypothetical protein AAGI71_12965 [Bacteroidota bacterium]
MRLPPLALLAVFFGLSACDTAEDPTPIDPVIPLAVGNTWVLEPAYTLRYEVQEGIVTSADTSRSSQRRSTTLSITRDTLINGEPWFRMETTSEVRAYHNVFGAPQWLANRADGLYAFDETPKRLYATDTAPSEPFSETRAEVTVLLDATASYTLSDQRTMSARAYQRTIRYLEDAVLEGLDAPAGPISPAMIGAEYLSAEEGIVALDVQYVALREDRAPGWIPALTQRWEVVSYTGN